MKHYIDIPQIIHYKDIIENDFNLSSNTYKKLIMKNKNYKTLRDLLDRHLNRNDLGFEVGSQNYIKHSHYFFMRSKALQASNFLPNINAETTLAILPQAFIKMNLRENDIIISKDSNIGEVVILDKDYPNMMLSGAMYKLPISTNKYYILAMIKHNVFREQLDFIVPKGATIRHAKTLFLDCKIPFPNHDTQQTIDFIEILTKSIIKKEKLIKQRHEKILHLIKDELLNNQKPNTFSYQTPTLHDIQNIGRLDTGVYCEEFKKWKFIVQNYKYGSKNLIDRGFTYSRGTSLEKGFIGSRIDSNFYIKGFYELFVPTHITEYGTISKTSFIGTKVKLKTIKQGDIIFGGEATFKSCVIIENLKNIATNYHGIRLINKNNDLVESIFIRCFLEFCRIKNIIKNISVGGQGGHCAPSYFHLIETPLFPPNKQQEIATLYHNPNSDLNYQSLTLDNFEIEDDEFCLNAGIYDLDKNIKYLKQILNSTIDKIIDDEKIEISFIANKI